MTERLILAFGDSLTAGFGLYPTESFPARLEARLHAEGEEDTRVFNAGLSGDTTTGGRLRLPHVLSMFRARPHLAILELGANDMLNRHDPRLCEANLGAMLALFRDHEVPVILAGMYAAPLLGRDYVEAFNAIYPRLAEAHGVPLYPFFMDGVVMKPELLLADRLHPNAVGADVIARNISPVVLGELRRLASLR